jgi:hypothetical protein
MNKIKLVKINKIEINLIVIIILIKFHRKKYK